ncbi:hypothetical protein [Nocardiopsis dassonvillei]|uniref:hypothetical protein n=1 Tax=Nocardiopsis dassonvillei TaxID=2014 RepID=UPI0036360EE5
MSDRTTLTTWASAHSVRVTYLGPDHQGHAVYGAINGPLVRVYVDTSQPDPHPRPLSWESPLEHLEEVAPVDRELEELIAGQWTLTLERTRDGRSTEVVAYRPLGWTGPGDPFERIAAPDREQLRAALARRQTQETP